MLTLEKGLTAGESCKYRVGHLAYPPWWDGGWLSDSPSSRRHQHPPPHGMVYIMILSIWNGINILLKILRVVKKTVREAPFNKSPPLFGHCPNSIYTPPRTQTGTLGHFFSGAILPFYHFYHFVYHFL